MLFTNEYVRSGLNLAHTRLERQAFLPGIPEPLAGPRECGIRSGTRDGEYCSEFFTVESLPCVQEQDLSIAFANTGQGAAEFRVEQSTQLGVLADADPARLRHLVDGQIDVLAAVVGEREASCPIQPGQHSIQWNILAAAPGCHEDFGGEILGILARATPGEVAHERG